MKIRIVFILIFVCLSNAYAIPITPFMDTDTYIRRASDIVIADSLVDPNQIPEVFDVAISECNVVYVLKGNRKPGKCKVAAIWPLKSDTRYLLTNTGGYVGDVNFLAIAELAAIPIPYNCDIEKLKKKPLKDQIYMIFDLRRYEVQRQLDPLISERDLLQKGLQNRTDNLYVSPRPINIETIHTTHAKDDSITYLRFGSHQLEWSRGGEKSGYLYADEPVTRKVEWQWSVLDVTDFDQLQGEPLTQRFQGVYPPIYGQTLTVKEGQMVLLRFGEEPQTAYIAKFEKQEGDTVYVKYIVVTE